MHGGAVKFFRWLWSKFLGGWWIYWNLTNAAMGAHVADFLDRAGTTAGRRLRWRIALTAVLIVNSAVVCAALAVLAPVLLAVALLFLATTYLYGHLVEIWRG